LDLVRVFAVASLERRERFARGKIDLTFVDFT